MTTSQILARSAAVCTGVAAVWNIAFSLVWIAALVWVLVGLLWIVPLLLGLVELALAMSVVMGGPRRASPVAPLLGMVVSVLNFNFLALILDLVALLCTAGSFVTRASEPEHQAG